MIQPTFSITHSFAAIAPSPPGQLWLAPMEGVMDAQVRDLLTRLGGVDLCVTEFVRVVDQLLPAKVFYRFCPELLHGGCTPSGVPVRVQLLGQQPQPLAENAARAVELGSPGVDLNFGCPAKTVNNSKGGAVLLKEPESLYRIVSAVRAAVPPEHPVTAKMRLGYDDPHLALDNARALAAAGADVITVHARTKADGYRPPAYWDWIARIGEVVATPLIANGEIWNGDDARRCRHESACADLMIGRGALSLPNLAAVIQHDAAPLPWPQVVQLLLDYCAMNVGGRDQGSYFVARIKQWFSYLKRQYPQAPELFSHLRTLNSHTALVQCLAAERQRLE